MPAFINLQANSPRVESSQGHNSDTLEDVDEQGFTAACQNELKLTISSYKQAADDLVQHRSNVKLSSSHGVAGDLDEAFKRIAAAKNVRRILTIACVTFGILGGGLVLGGAGVPFLTFGVALLTVSVAIGVHIWMTQGAGTTISDVVISIPSLKFLSNEWIYQNRDLCNDLIKTCKEYHERLEHICQKYDESEENAIKTALAFNCDEDEREITQFRRAHRTAKLVITEWNKALDLGAEATATAFLTGACVHECLEPHGLDSESYADDVSSGGTRHVCCTTMTQCPKCPLPVVRVFVQTAGGKVICLSAVFMVVDLALISKTAYDFFKNKKGTELANKLLQAADDMKKETAQLQPLANFANDK